jgi:hypothetical protein
LPPERKWVFKYPPIKQWQWMILSHSFISELINNPQALILLAYMEHHAIPDEVHFGLFLDVLFNIYIIWSNQFQSFK